MNSPDVLVPGVYRTSRLRGSELVKLVLEVVEIAPVMLFTVNQVQSQCPLLSSTAEELTKGIGVSSVVGSVAGTVGGVV